MHHCAFIPAYHSLILSPAAPVSEATSALAAAALLPQGAGCWSYLLKVKLQPAIGWCCMPCCLLFAYEVAFLSCCFTGVHLACMLPLIVVHTSQCFNDFFIFHFHSIPYRLHAHSDPCSNAYGMTKSLLHGLIVVFILMCFTENHCQLLHSNAQGWALSLTPALVSSAGGCCTSSTLGIRRMSAVDHCAQAELLCALCLDLVSVCACKMLQMIQYTLQTCLSLWSFRYVYVIILLRQIHMLSAWAHDWQSFQQWALDSGSNALTVKQLSTLSQSNDTS